MSEIQPVPPRARLQTDIPTRISRALAIRAAKNGTSVARIIENFVKEHLADDLDIADEALAREAAQGEAEPGKTVRTRKPPKV